MLAPQLFRRNPKPFLVGLIAECIGQIAVSVPNDGRHVIKHRLKNHLSL